MSSRRRNPALLVTAVVLVVLTLLSPTAGATEEATISQAMGLFGKQDFSGAAKILDEVTRRDPENARAWSLLGFALHAAGEFDRALTVHHKAAEFESNAPNAFYNIGMIHSIKNDPDAAFEWLFRAKDTGKVDLTQAAFDTDSENIRTDPRFRKLFPSDPELDDPFVERVAVLHEWVGEASGDQFGWIARNIGDVDGDGAHDFSTSAPTHGENAGKVYTYSGRSGKLLWTHAGNAEDQLGLGIEAAGDVNGDGVPDVIAGAPPGGRVLVLSGKDGAVLIELTEKQEGEGFGRGVADVGDVNGDGFGDVLVGAPANDAAGEDAGRAYLFSGQDGGELYAWSGERAGDRFGSSGAGFAQGGEVFIVIGAPNAGPGNGGRVYVHRGLVEEPAFTIEADSTGANLGGMFVSVVGDVDADGTPDVYASDWSNAALGRSTGRIFVHGGADGGRVCTFTGEAAGDGFGIGPADAGDVDGDGYDDLVIGSWRHSSAAPAAGKVYLYSGKSGAVIRAYTCKVPGDTFGFDATGMDDVDGDGTIDLLLTSAWSAVRGPRTGRVFLVSSR